MQYRVKIKEKALNVISSAL